MYIPTGMSLQDQGKLLNPGMAGPLLTMMPPAELSHLGGTSMGGGMPSSWNHGTVLCS